MPPKGTKKTTETTPEPTEADLFDEKTADAGSIADLAGTASGGSFEGDLLKMDAIKDKKHYILDFTLRPSSFREGGSYIAIQIKRKDGTLNVVNSTAVVILKLANADKSKLPMPNAFMQRPPTKAGGKPYWDFAHTDELAKLAWL
jgi:hypothetical protein